MRILHVTDNYPPATGGLERAVQAMATATAAAGDEVRVATLARPGVGTETTVTENGVVVHRLLGLTRHLARFTDDADHQFHPTLPDPQLVSRLHKLIADFRPDIVHAHGWILNSCPAVRLPTTTRLVVTLHDYGLSCAKMTRQQGTVLDVACTGPHVGKCLRCAGQFYGAAKAVPLVLGLAAGNTRLAKVSLFLPISQAVADLALPGVAPDRIRIVPAFVADSVAAEAEGPRPDFLPDGDFTLFVGALGPHKGVDTLLAAHRRQQHDVPLVLIGPRRSDTPPIADLTGRPVTVLDGAPHEQIMRAFRAATLTVVPSRWPEPLGLVAIEAMAAGSPVIASAVGGLAELVGDSGELVAPGDVDLLAATMDRLLGEPSRRAELSRRGPARAAEFTESAVIGRLRAAYGWSATSINA